MVFCCGSFLVMDKVKKKKFSKWFAPTNFASALGKLPLNTAPRQQASYIMSKSQKPNHHLLRGLVEWNHGHWDLGSREWLCSGSLVSAFSFMQKVFFFFFYLMKGHHGMESFHIGNLGSSSATLEVRWSLSVKVAVMILPGDLLCGLNENSPCESTCWCGAGTGNCWQMWLFFSKEISLEAD